MKLQADHIYLFVEKIKAIQIWEKTENPSMELRKKYLAYDTRMSQTLHILNNHQIKYFYDSLQLLHSL